MLYCKFKGSIHTVERSKPNFNRLQLLNAAYDLFYPDHKSSIEHYFKTIQIILEYIDKGDVSEKDKEFYINIFCTQLSSHEFYLILYHTLSILSKLGDDTMIELIKKYDFFKYLKNTEFKEIIDDIDLLINTKGESEEHKES